MPYRAPVSINVEPTVPVISLKVSVYVSNPIVGLVVMRSAFIAALVTVNVIMRHNGACATPPTSVKHALRKSVSTTATEEDTAKTRNVIVRGIMRVRTVENFFILIVFQS